MAIFGGLAVISEPRVPTDGPDKEAKYLLKKKTEEKRKREAPKDSDRDSTPWLLLGRSAEVAVLPGFSTGFLLFFFVLSLDISRRSRSGDSVPAG